MSDLSPPTIGLTSAVNLHKSSDVMLPNPPSRFLPGRESACTRTKSPSCGTQYCCTNILATIVGENQCNAVSGRGTVALMKANRNVPKATVRYRLGVFARVLSPRRLPSRRAAAMKTPGAATNVENPNFCNRYNDKLAQNRLVCCLYACGVHLNTCCRPSTAVAVAST